VFYSWQHNSLPDPLFGADVHYTTVPTHRKVAAAEHFHLAATASEKYAVVGGDNINIQLKSSITSKFLVRNRLYAPAMRGVRGLFLGY
jgi:hypothetical protein